MAIYLIHILYIHCYNNIFMNCIKFNVSGKNVNAEYRLTMLDWTVSDLNIASSKMETALEIVHTLLQARCSNSIVLCNN